jgi:hypothetical protein
MFRTTSITKQDTTRYAIHLNVLFPPRACVDNPVLAGAARAYRAVEQLRHPISPQPLHSPGNRRGCVRHRPSAAPAMDLVWANFTRARKSSSMGVPRSISKVSPTNSSIVLKWHHHGENNELVELSSLHYKEQEVYPSVGTLMPHAIQIRQTGGPEPAPPPIEPRPTEIGKFARPSGNRLALPGVMSESGAPACL